MLRLRECFHASSLISEHDGVCTEVVGWGPEYLARKGIRRSHGELLIIMMSSVLIK